MDDFWMRLFLGMCLLWLAACNDNPIEVDQCMRRKYFVECMEMAGQPETTHYNDAAELVEECDSTAYFQAKRNRSNIKPECRAAR